MKRFFNAMPLMLLACLTACRKDTTLQTASIKLQMAKEAQLLTTTTGTNYYVDPNGDDNNNGTSTSSPWKTLAKVNGQTFAEGDHLYFKSGGIWNGTLTLLGSGTAASPIVIDKYDTGNKPVINGGGPANGSATILLQNVSYWEVNNLEITNTSINKYALIGIYANNTSSSAMTHIYVKSCYVHDVNSTLPGTTNYSKGSGGIIYNGLINDVLVQNNHVAKCDIEGIRTNANTMATGVIFDNNEVEDVYGDGIVFHGVLNGQISNNLVHNVCKSPSVVYAGIWTYLSKGTVVSYNEVYGLTGGGGDGEAFDADESTDGDIFEYNYSHDNSRGFMLFMPSAKNIIVRYNVSANDVIGGLRLIEWKPSNNTNKLYNNVFYLTNNITQIFKNKAFVGEFSNNIFYSKGTYTKFSEVPLTASAVFKNNCFSPAPGTLWDGSTHSGNIFSNPFLSNPSGYGIGRSTASAFKLSNSSPCIDKGLTIANNGGLDFFGTTLSGTIDVGVENH
ncbi:right-handed parallel beta-helix repeat-containing protein [Pedobacter sp. GSP4]|uniref:right-handed parallel beta-helix repeat-containing protein n=1 Tax=Pedobacter sp. GSP4 TaxID=3453716 RepID=UPI003EEDF6F0